MSQSSTAFRLLTDQGYYVKMCFENASKHIMRSHMIVTSEYIYCQGNNGSANNNHDTIVEFLLLGSNLKIESIAKDSEYALGITFAQLLKKLDSVKKKDKLILEVFQESKSTLDIAIINDTTNKKMNLRHQLENFPESRVEIPKYVDSQGRALKPNACYNGSTFVKNIKAINLKIL